MTNILWSYTHSLNEVFDSYFKIVVIVIRLLDTYGTMFHFFKKSEVHVYYNQSYIN